MTWNWCGNMRLKVQKLHFKPSSIAMLIWFIPPHFAKFGILIWPKKLRRRLS